MEFPKEKNYFTIGEVARRTGIPVYTLRYWENKFRLLRPVRRETGRRLYTLKDLESVAVIKDLLYRRGFTLTGAKKVLHSRRLKSGKKQVCGEAGPADSGLIGYLHKELLAVIKEC